MAIGGAISQLTTIVEVETGAISILIGIKEDVRSVIFVVTIPLARDCMPLTTQHILSCATVGL